MKTWMMIPIAVKSCGLSLCLSDFEDHYFWWAYLRGAFKQVDLYTGIKTFSERMVLYAGGSISGGLIHRIYSLNMITFLFLLKGDWTGTRVASVYGSVIIWEQIRLNHHEKASWHSRGSKKTNKGICLGFDLTYCNLRFAMPITLIQKSGK